MSSVVLVVTTRCSMHFDTKMIKSHNAPITLYYDCNTLHLPLPLRPSVRTGGRTRMCVSMRFASHSGGEVTSRSPYTCTTAWADVDVWNNTV